MIRLFDLAGADPDIRFSPNCWRIRMALAHKGLDAETVPWRFTDTAAIAFSGQGRVPVLVDGDTVVAESWQIARYLDQAYPDTPPLLAGPQAVAHARFIVRWTERVLHPGIARQVLTDIHSLLADRDRAYFRESREKAFGMPLEQVVADADARLPALRAALPFVGGETASYADHVVFGAFQWARVCSPRAILADDDRIRRWFDTMLGLYDGLGARMPARA